ncbi:Bcr/CflA family drug resistance efflux transporter [Acinetobacter sp. ANC 5054]|uniref:multidrug effflux MFS transporter n=1 Tax=Acinetobacter sp. ANC 5054 TaxID=1977877 RepID=UPI000A34019F|nr:multidrug effflux MFS transporter [Acinetobacter sp. ANC 5054]OTG78042.1 Bcr/CflA family drug resistance efflux transporter [Acinetobacter sp. ANC 5054]
MSGTHSKTDYSQRWILLLALLTALGPLSIDMYLPALPQMAQDFQVSTQQVANSLPAYFLGLAIGQLIYGPVSDRIGRKKPLYFGLILYTLASFLCVFADNEWSLIAARVLQALGGCVGVVIARAAIRDRLSMQASAQAFASMMIVMTIAPVVAPTLGAWILSVFEWQYIFGLLILVGLICLTCVHFFFKETLEPERRLNLSFKQVLHLYSVILQDPTFRKPMLAGCFSGAVLFCYISASSSIFMDGYGLSQQHFAYVFGGNAVGIMLFSTLNKKLATRIDVHHRLKMGNVFQLCGVLILLVAGALHQAPIVIVMLGMFLCVASIGFTGPNAMALAMSEQGSRAGTASAIMGSAQFACGLLGGVLLNFLVWSALTNMAIVMLLFVAIAMYTSRGLTAFKLMH